MSKKRGIVQAMTRLVLLVNNYSGGSEVFYMRLLEQQVDQMRFNERYKLLLLMEFKFIVCERFGFRLSDYRALFAKRAREWHAADLLVRRNSGCPIESSIIDLTAPEFQLIKL